MQYPTGPQKLLVQVFPEMDFKLQPMAIAEMTPHKWYDFGMFVKTAPFDDSARIVLHPVWSPPERDAEHYSFFDINSPNIVLRKIAEGRQGNVKWRRSMMNSVRRCYKIHLMLSAEQLCSGFLHIFVMMACNDIMGFKYCKPSEKSLLEENRGKIGNPTVVIYCRPDLACAQRALDWAKYLFGQMPVINLMVPRYNIHVAGPVYYSGGDGDVKDYMISRKHPLLKELFEEKVGYALYVGQPPLRF